MFGLIAAIEGVCDICLFSGQLETLQGACPNSGDKRSGLMLRTRNHLTLARWDHQWTQVRAGSARLCVSS